jgi:carboxyl-terminal processing protease
MNSDQNKKYILISLVIAVAFGGFLGGYFFANKGFAIQFSPPKFINLNEEDAPKEVNWQILWEALNVINSKYVGRPVDELQLMYGAVAGAVASLGDPYSIFLTPTKSEEFQQDLRGEFSGIGAEIGLRNNQLMVIAPLEGSPAEDAILAIDGESTLGVNLDEAVNKIRGQKGTTVVLTVISNQASEPKEVSIVRDNIVVKSVESEIKEVGGKKFGVIKLRRFGEDTSGDLDAAINTILSENISGVVLDLRNNPGGFIISAIDVASNWVEDGQVIVTERFGTGRELPHKASGSQRLAGIPTVVLVNEGSASASEIVAGALRDYEIAQIVGKKTFGKGSVQELVNLPDGADLKITIAVWLTPSGVNINENGIQPDIEVSLEQEDVDNFADPQLDRALEILDQGE